MRKVHLIRVRQHKGETYGVLLIDNQPRFVTLELEWRNNIPKVSSIPVGRYKCIEWESPKFGWTYKVLDVKGREDILFHWGNTARDTRGCILIGSSYANEVLLHGVQASRIAFGKFLRFLRNEKSFELIVTEVLWDNK